MLLCSFRYARLANNSSAEGRMSLRSRAFGRNYTDGIACKTVMGVFSKGHTLELGFATFNNYQFVENVSARWTPWFGEAN